MDENNLTPVNNNNTNNNHKISQFRLIISMFIDYFTKKYTEMSIWTVIVSLFGIFYLFSPINILQDVTIPFIGLIDDAAIVAFIFHQIKKELKKYEQWRNNNV